MVKQFEWKSERKVYKRIGFEWKSESKVYKWIGFEWKINLKGKFISELDLSEQLIWKESL